MCVLLPPLLLLLVLLVLLYRMSIERSRVFTIVTLKDAGSAAVVVVALPKNDLT